jgi:anaerobic dimethyl sulfoxide reductase subunit C (anchor subunit)/Tat-targeted selenate reductase subunit YnfH
MSHDDGHGPLVAFTSLAVAGAGTLAAWAWATYAGTAWAGAPWPGIACLVAGLVTSTWHLGRRDRAHLAARGLGRSPISNEAALGALTVAGAVVAAAGLAGGRFGSALTAVTGVVAAAFLVSIGLVYRLGGQLTWTGFAAATPLTAGLAFGAVLIDGARGAAGPSTLTLAALGVDAFVFMQRWRRVAQVSLDHAASLPPSFARRHELLAARFLLVNALPCVSLFVWPSPLSAVIAGAGLVVDRLAFYDLALQHRTEVEIRRVEALLDRADPPRYDA